MFLIVGPSGKRFRRFQFRFRFRGKRFRRCRFPVPVRFLSHPEGSAKFTLQDKTHLKIGRKKNLSGPVLRDTARLSQRYPPSLRAMGFLVSQHGQLSAIPLPPFLSVSPLESIREVEVRYPPSKGVSQRYWRDTL